ncbi:MAG: hypothetical protein LBL61_01580 [Elusimicrobiota bacterium]|jgi:hypothetical protein|nr:hypothetical protein [Elusimicrobiota bacterium]
MKRLLLLAFVAMCFPAYSTASQTEEPEIHAVARKRVDAPAQGPIIENISQIPAMALKKIPFKDKEALLKEMNFWRDAYLNNFRWQTLEDEMLKAPDLCDNKDVVMCIIGSLHRALIPQLFDEHEPRKYSNTYFLFEEQLEDSKTEEEFLERAAAIGRKEDENFALLSARYKAAFKAVTDVFMQVERSLPKRLYLSPEQENALYEKLDWNFTEERLRSLTAEELDIYKKSLVLAIIKTNAPEVLHYLMPYISALFDSILTNSPQREKVAGEAVNSMIKINRKKLDKTIKAALIDFDKKIKG